MRFAPTGGFRYQPTSRFLIVSIFSLIAFYMNRLYAASDQNENQKKSGSSSGSALLCAHYQARESGWTLGLAGNVCRPAADERRARSAGALFGGILLGVE
jgi:hypothetical protein